MLDVSYSDVMTASADSLSHAYGFKYVIVQLDKGDVMDNPASTKRRVYGPGIWLWEIDASGVTAREYDHFRFIPRELVAGAACIPSVSDQLDKVFPGFKRVMG